MNDIRAFFKRRLHLAALVLLLALGMKALVPAGYMIGPADGLSITVSICNGSGAEQTITIPMEDDGKDSGQHESSNGGDGICSFTALSHATSDNPVPLAILLIGFAFIMALGLARLAFSTRPQFKYTRPPSQAPPFFA
ncbi:MAG: hypothetical protein V7676_05775 [Parasphingorhabdus sp.]|uniref:hypothetical protein n=1 Tax=Parasphingorhabdus sp. TaxID=2709688 RepID=UPI0030024EEE